MAKAAAENNPDPYGNEAPLPEEQLPGSGPDATADVPIDVDVGDAVELQSVPQGEYQLRIVDATVARSQKTGGMFLNARLEIVGQPYTKDITHVMMFPAADDDAKKKNNRKLALKNFYEAFGVDYSRPVTVGVLKGREAWAVLREEDDPEYGLQNRVRKWVVGA